MSGPGALDLLTGCLLDAGLKATVVVGLAALAAQGLRHGPAARRHAVWAVALGSLPVLPALAFARGPSLAVDAPAVVAVWALGAVVAGLPLLRSVRHVRRLHAESTPDPVDPALRRHPAVVSPMTWGSARAVVLVPEGFDRWSATHRSAALAHERAHIARRDGWVHVAAWAVCVLFWFHPAVWWARRALVREAEHAADDAVIAAGVRPSDYAALLLSMAEAPRGVALGVGGSELGARVHAVLRPADRRPFRGRAVAAALLAGLLLLPPLAAWPAWTTPPEASPTCQPEPGRLLP